MMMMRIELIDEDSPFYKNMFDDDDGKEQNIIISNHQKRWINLIDLKKENSMSHRQVDLNTYMLEQAVFIVYRIKNVGACSTAVLRATAAASQRCARFAEEQVPCETRRGCIRTRWNSRAVLCT